MIGLLRQSVGPTSLCDEFAEGGTRPDLVVGTGKEIDRAVDILDLDAASVAIVPVRNGIGVDFPGREDGPAARLERRVVAYRVGSLPAVDRPGREPQAATGKQGHRRNLRCSLRQFEAGLAGSSGSYEMDSAGATDFVQKRVKIWSFGVGEFLLHSVSQCPQELSSAVRARSIVVKEEDGLFFTSSCSGRAAPGNGIKPNSYSSGQDFESEWEFTILGKDKVPVDPLLTMHTVDRAFRGDSVVVVSKARSRSGIE